MKLFKKICITLSVIIAIMIISLATVKLYSYYVEERVSILPLKMLNILIIEDEVIDYSRIGMVKKVPWFDLWSRSERNKLIEYMKSNNLVIQPGFYGFNQTDRFEKVLRVLKFKKRE